MSVAPVGQAGAARLALAGRADRKQPLPVVLRVAQLIAHPANIREDLTAVDELAASIREHGLLQPLTVTPHPSIEGRFLILAGHRRARASMLAGLVAVPCVIRDVTDRDEQVTLMLVENCQRVDLNPIEQATALGALKQRGLSAQDLVRMTGKSMAWVYDRLALLELSEDDQRAIAEGRVKAYQANDIIRQRRKEARGADARQRGTVWDPPFFAPSHPLARKAGRLCDGREHSTRRRVGKVACGQCWEYVIREDERTVIAVARSIAQEEDDDAVR